MRVRRAGGDHTNGHPRSVCSACIFRRTSSYRISRYRHALDGSTETPVQRRNARNSRNREHTASHFVHQERNGSKPCLIWEKRVAYRLDRFFRRISICACAHMRACVRVFRNRYNRYIPLLYPRASLKNQGCRARTVYRFFKIEAQKWNTSHPDTSSQKPSRSGKKPPASLYRFSESEVEHAVPTSPRARRNGSACSEGTNAIACSRRGSGSSGSRRAARAPSPTTPAPK